MGPHRTAPSTPPTSRRALRGRDHAICAALTLATPYFAIVGYYDASGNRGSP